MARASAPVQIIDAPHMHISEEDDSLNIFSIGSRDQGFYYCRVGGSTVRAYLVTVGTADEPTTVLTEGNVTGDASPLPGVRLFSDWTPWTECSNCAPKVGRKERIGYCMISYTTAQGNFISLEDQQLLSLFPTGVPCRSKYLTQTLRERQFMERPDEYEIFMCRVTCPSKMFIVRNRDGVVIDRVNNSAGVYSSLQGMVRVDPPVRRSTAMTREGEDVMFPCPGSANKLLPLTWYRDEEQIFPVQKAEISLARVLHDEKGRLNIRDVKPEDGLMSYVCKQGSDVAGVVHLIVIPDTSSDYEMFHLFAIISFYVYISFLANRKLNNTHN